MRKPEHCDHRNKQDVGSSSEEGMGHIIVYWCPNCGALKRTMTNWKNTDYPWELPHHVYDDVEKTSEPHFVLDGKNVYRGQRLYVAPRYHRQAGPHGVVQRIDHDTVVLRSDNGAVPVVPISALSWEPHPETVAMEQLTKAGFRSPSSKDVRIWIAATKQATNTTQI